MDTLAQISSHEEAVRRAKGNRLRRRAHSFHHRRPRSRLGNKARKLSARVSLDAYQAKNPIPSYTYIVAVVMQCQVCRHVRGRRQDHAKEIKADVLPRAGDSRFPLLGFRRCLSTSGVGQM